MEFRILGDLEVVDGGVDVPIRGARQRALLALLLVRSGETVRADRLADDLWGDDLPAGAANALQALISKLRRALGPASELLVTGPSGYCLDVAGDDIDAARFTDEAERGQRALAAGDPATASSLLTEALARWRGPPLDGMCEQSDGVLLREATRLEQLRLAAVEARCDAELRLGRHAELVGELEALVAAEPFREGLHALLMLALYRAGRQADALAAFQSARKVLGEELGLDPGKELRDLEAAILAQDPALDPPSPSGAEAAPRRRSNLAPPLSSFVGRADELERLSGLVDDHRLVTVVGPGGAGKTRLALEVAAGRIADEDTWLVELAPLGDPAAVVDATAAALGVVDGGVGASVLDRIVEHVSGRDTVVVLDNCEHVVGEAARIAEGLLQRCPQLRILATSREALGIGGETIWPVPPMRLEDAAALFVDRGASASGFALTSETAPVVSDLCARLDGLPLAIELAAARVRAIPVQQLAGRLDDRFRLLTGGSRNALPRQQTLRAVVEWSYDLLFDDEQRLFERLSVFAGGCSLDTAEAVCAGDDIASDDVADLLLRLVDKSLVVADHSGGAARYQLLQTLALYGRERLAASDDAHEARSRHAAHFAALCTRGPAAFRGTDQAAWLGEVHRERDNLRAALGWLVEQGDAEGAVAMVGGLGWSWWLSPRGDEGVRWFREALDCPGATKPETRALALMWAGAVLANVGGAMDEALALGEQAVALCRDGDDELALAEAIVLEASTNIRMGHAERTMAGFGEAAALLADRDDHWSRGVAMSATGRAAALRGDVVEADRCNLESVAHFEAAGAEWATSSVNSDLALVAEMRGDIAAAIDRTERAYAASSRLVFRLAEAQLLARLGNLVLIQGDAERAEELHERSMALAEETGSKPSYGAALNGRAIARRLTGQLDEAAGFADRARVIYHDAGLISGEALAFANLGFIAERQGRVDEAAAFHQQSLALARRLGEPLRVALAVEGLAGVAAAAGDVERAAHLIGAARALRAGAGGGTPGTASDVDRITALVVDVLGRDGFAAAEARGETMSVDDLVPAARP